MEQQDAIHHAKAIEIGKLAVRSTTAAGTGHPTSALSLAHLVTALMYRVMRWDPSRPDDPDADRLVLSEGHAVPIIYAACADLGVAFAPGGETRALNVADLDTLRAIDSPLDGHPNPRVGFPFFDAATGSLGQGLSIAAGLGAAARIDGTDRRVFCLMGDGESREGQVWEAMDFIADHGIRNVVAIFNCNTLGQSDLVSDAQSPETLARKADAFGWRVRTIDGHAPREILSALEDPGDVDRPLCIVARTVKGWGVPELGGTGHHGTAVPDKQVAEVIAALDRKAVELGADRVAADDMRRIEAPRRRRANGPGEPGQPDGFADALATDRKSQDQVAAKGTLSPRRAFGLALQALGRANPQVVAIDGDVKNSTYAQMFADAFPERYLEGRIAEQNMVSVAAGLAAAGKLPFVSSFGKFLVRAYDQLEMAIISGADIKLVGTHVGVTIASDGPSQMALADIAFMRAYAHVRDARDAAPAMTVLTPSDAASAYALTLAMAAHRGACYLRAVRADLPVLYKDDDRFRFGGHKVLRVAGQSVGGVVLVAVGYLVHSALEAADRLEERGIPASVIDAYSLPMDVGPVLQLAREQQAPILVAEDSYRGGVGSEIAEAAASGVAPPRVHAMAVERLPKSGRSPDDLLRFTGLSVDDVVATAVSLVSDRDENPDG